MSQPMGSHLHGLHLIGFADDQDQGEVAFGTEACLTLSTCGEFCEEGRNGYSAVTGLDGEVVTSLD